MYVVSADHNRVKEVHCRDFVLNVCVSVFDRCPWLG